MKTNLLLLDSLKNSESLLSFAFSFSNRFRRKLKIIYVFDLKWMGQSYMSGATAPMDAGFIHAEKMARKEFEEAQTKLRAMVDEYLKHNLTQVPYEISTSELNRVDLVEEELKKDKDLMLLINNYQSYAELSGGLIHYPNIINDVKCPVFVIPEDTPHVILKDVVYATDYNPEDITSLKHLSTFLKQAEHTHIMVLHNEKEVDFDEKLKWKGFKEVVKEEVDFDNFDFTLESQEDFRKGIEDYSSEHKTDLLVLMHEKKGFFEQFFSSSDVKNVLTHFDKPVLVYHEQ
ncbi:universal stress protein [Maribellus maritimus]|uniref:universal stress protein n=1 Tax=Maribellus maritimus TaxID=2870838 RepID=UPI001EEB5E76|nr:universal stress protein [Maribellus maritimus]MCG6187890.1 universal stress protein [Maribellus maritimus]